MTRLRKEDLEPIAGNLHGYDARLKRIVGVSLRGIACKASGVEEALMGTLAGRVRVVAVPVSSGLGVIHGFSHTVSAIVSHLGFDAIVTDGSDLPGVVEGIEGGGQVLMMADDERFVAFVPGLRRVVDNASATARGFVAGLELMRGGLAGESVLVLGCGRVGVAAAKVLIYRGASIALCDIEEGRARAAAREIGQGPSERIMVEEDPPTALGRHDLIFDATNAGGFIEAAHLTPGTLVAAPGMPCGLTPAAMAENRERVLHDALEIGTATMAVQAAAALVATESPWEVGGR